MKKRFATGALLICISALAASSIFAEAEKTIVTRPQRRFTVGVEVTCADESLQFRLLSLRKKELRKRGDVRVVGLDEKPDYLISLVAVKNKAGGKEVGYSYSYSFFKKHYYSAELQEAIDHFYGTVFAGMTENERAKVSKLYANAIESNRDYSEYLDGGIQTVAYDAVENVCKLQVAALEQRV
ncbi:MAG: hypothetical protein H8E62_10145 [Planctomycetes bacterium]|nr:hypothetical protein [Planctomycetota bacterium]